MKSFKSSKKILMVILILALALELTPFRSFALASSVVTPSESREGETNTEDGDVTSPEDAALLAEEIPQEGSTPQGDVDPQAEGDESSTDLTMNNHKFEWVSGNYTTTISDDKLSLETRPTAKDKAQVKGRVTFSVGGNDGVKAGEAVIRIPRYVFETRDGQPTGDILLSIPQAPNTGGTTSFNYAIEDNGTPDDPSDDVIVIRNYEDIKKGGFVMEVDIVWYYPPIEVANGYEVNDITAEFQVTGSTSGVTKEAESNPASLKLNTYTYGPRSTKEKKTKFDTWKSQWGEAPENAEDYYYVVWKLGANIASGSTSAYSVYFDDMALDGGQIVACSESYSHAYSSAEPKTFQRVTEEELKTTPIYEVKTNKDYNDYTSLYPTKDVVVAYPKSMLEGGATPTVQNKMEARVETPEGDVKKSEAVASYTYEYVSFDVPYEGDSFGTDKKPRVSQLETALEYPATIKGAADLIKKGVTITNGFTVGTKNYGWNQTGVDDGTGNLVYGEKPYETVIRDGMMYVDGERLEPDDYDLISFGPYLYNTYTAVVDPDVGASLGISTDYENYEPIDVYVKKADGQWEKFGYVEKTASNKYKWAGEDGTVNNNVTTSTFINLPEGVKDIKFVHSGKDYGVNYRMSLKYKLYPTEHVKSIVEDLSTFTVTNISEAWGEQDGEIYTPGNKLKSSTTGTIKEDVENSDMEDYGAVDKVCHATASHSYTPISPISSLTKSMSSPINDTNNGLVKTTVNLTTSNYVSLSSLGITLNEAADLRLIPDSREGIFYDLLPKGTTVDFSTMKATVKLTNCIDNPRMPDCEYTVEMIENWRDSGQTMMKVTVNAPEGFRTYLKNNSYLETGFSLRFTLIDSWDNIEANGTSLVNDASYYGFDGSYASGEADTGGRYNKEMFEDLDGDGNEDEDADKNCLYATATRNVDVARAAQMGFTKRVKSVESIGYDNKTTVPLTGGYSYQLRFALEDKANASGVILYDVIENAYTDADNGHWVGTFNGINTTQIRDAYPEADVQIYYSVSKDIVKEDGQIDTGIFDVSKSDIWVKGVPTEDKYSEVTAIAIDLSKTKSGNTMKFEGKMAITAEVYMKAPSEESLLDQENTLDVDESVKAKNKAYLTQEGKEMEGSNTTTVTPVKPNIKITKSSYPSTGTKTYPRTISAGSELKYTLVTSNDNVAEAIEDITVVDTIPDHLTIDAANIKYYFGNNPSDAKPADGTGRVAVKVDGQKLTFTVDKLAAKEKVYFLIPTTVDASANKGVDFTNQATITEFNDAEWDIDSNEVYHKTNPVTVNVAVQKVWDDNNNQYGRRVPISVALYGDGEAITGKTAILNQSNSWKATFVSLPKYREDGVTPITYSVEEEAVPGYAPVYTNASGTLVVRNTAQTVDEEVAATFKVKKLREGTNITVPGVKFELYDGTKKLSEGVTDASGFANFTVQPEGTEDFEVKLEEVSAPQGYIVDSTPITIKLHREQRQSYDVENGQIVISHYWTVSSEDEGWNSQTATLTLSNEYVPKPAKLEIPVSKVVTGVARPQEKTFEFTLTPVGSAPMPAEAGEKITIEGSETAQTANFGEITFSTPGTYQYKVKETVEAETGYTYDKTEHTVKVVVVDNGGILEASWTADEKTVDAVSFTNKYEPLATKLTLPAKKAISGNPRPEGQEQDFTFVLAGLSGAPMPTGDGNVLTVTDAGEGSFGAISFTKTGTFKYEVRETAGNAVGYTYEDTVHTITVTVEDSDGRLTATWKSDQDTDNKDETAGEKITFTNTYKPTPVELSVPVKKTITGSERDQKWLKDFTFKLEAKGEAPMPKGTGNAVKITDEGEEPFGTIKFEKAGVYEYTITENAENYPRYTFDTAVRNLKVTVSDNNGVLSAVWTVDDKQVDKVEFTNQYSPKETGLQIPITKLVGGDPIPSDHVETFNFTLVGRGEAPMPEEVGRSVEIANGDITNTLGVSSSFGGITFTKAGTFLYEIKETKSDKKGYVYDLSTRVVTVTVVDNNGYLNATWESNGADRTKVEFKNDYKPEAAIIEFPVKKTMTGNPRSDKYLKTFKFTLTAVTTGAPMPNLSETTIIDSGEGVIGQIAVEHAGTYKYTISEEEATNSGYTYDKKICEVLVTAVDNHGQIEATIEYKKDGETVNEADFSNNYDPSDAEVTLSVSKEVTGDKRPKNKDFTFVLEAKDDGPMPKTGEEQVIIKGGNDGEEKTGTFGKMTFDKAGTYHYSIKETKGAEKGYTYDSKVYDVTIKVVDTDGKLEAEVTYENGGKTAAAPKFKNQYKPESVDLNIGFTKIIEGNERSEDYLKDFNFTIVAQNGAPMPKESPVATITDEGTGQFNTITFEKAGTYTYQISETGGSDRGYSYDEGIFTITVTVTDVGGKLYASYVADTEREEAVFVNTYDPEDVTVTIPVQKIVTGNPRPDNNVKIFTFTLLGKGEVPMPEGTENVVTITDQGNGEFGEITFDKAGVYEYTVTETKGTETGYTYDESTYTVKITVADEDGVLEAEVSYKKGSAAAEKSVFTNIYRPIEVSFGVPVKKVIIGNERPEEKEFTFEEYDEQGNLLDTKTVTGEGEIAFDTITYTEAGTYTYTVAEKAGSDKGYTYDTSARTVVVTVVDEDGRLKASMTVDEEAEEKVTITNNYEPSEVTFAIPISKVIEGNARPEEKEFYFNEFDEEGNLLSTKAITGEGEAAFDAITYTEAGTYTYTVAEVEGNEKGYTYDSEERTVVVTVVDEDGSLKASMKVEEREASKVEFTNTYEPDETEVSLPVTKEIIGVARPEDNLKKFTFVLSAKGDEPMSEEEKISIEDAGEAKFGPIKFKEAGEYHYTISEENGKERGYIYDEKVYDVTVKVEDMGGILSATWLMNDVEEGKAEFVNEYNPEKGGATISLEKTISGDKPSSDATFRFELKKDDAVVDVAEVKGSGKTSFTKLDFDTAGSYTYEVTEVAEEDKGYTYDKTVYIVQITVKDDDGKFVVDMSVKSSGKDCKSIKFNNVYTKEKTPTGTEGEDVNRGDNPPSVSTGDSTSFVKWIVAMAVAVVAIVLILIFGKKKKDSDKK